MSKVRRLIAPVALALLLLHVSVIAGPAVLVIATDGAASDVICTCAHGADHGSCPMHHKPADSARCHMQSTQGDLGRALLSMLGPLTMPVATVAVVVDPSPSRPIEYQAPPLLDGAAPPDPPPPRV